MVTELNSGTKSHNFSTKKTFGAHSKSKGAKMQLKC